MVDYTQQKLRSIIYKERKDLDEFDVDNEKSLDSVMLEKLESSQIIRWERAHRYITDIFNQVYYITTLILMEKRPLHYLEKYVRIARHTSSYYNDDLSRETAFSNYAEPVIMAMVYNYLRAIKESNNKNVSRLLGGIADEYISSSITSDKHKLFCQFILDIKELKKLEVDESRFKPLCIPTEEDAKAAPANQLEEQEEKYRKLANDYVELEKEMEELKSEVLTLKNEDTEKIRQENEALKEQVNKYEKNKTGMTLGLNQTQAALFGLALANSFGFNYRNKKELAPMIHELFGWGKSKIEKKLCEGFSKDDKEKLCTIFKTLSPTLYTMLMCGGEKKKEVTPK